MLPGVYKNTKKDGTLYFRSSITYNGKHISLGSFDTEQSASLAYEQGNLLLHDSSISLDSYEDGHILPFSKWVILLNFRDNGMYIKTPIYLYKRYFYYFFEPDDFLTFDIDDLFYYSTRTISRRGGHLFVADYGMQVNILSRFGIKNHAIKDRDYRFINGDSKDFRYSNIEVINHYHGVTKKENRGTTYYETKIHWNGYFTVGRYKDEIEAAVAYNKAASILLTKGYKKQYPVNYIENLSKEEYHRIYKKAVVSQRILNLKPLL